MPAKSKAQQRFMGMVHAYKKGELKGSEVSTDVKDAATSMKKKDTKDFAKTKHKGLPNKVKKENLIKLIKSYLKQESLKESGIMYRAGVKKYGKEGMTKIVQAAGRKASHAEIGKIKDKYEKKKKESTDEGFGGDLKGSDKKKFEKARKANGEQLGYTLSGTPDVKEERDYKAEYKKYGSSTKAKKYRAELNKYNRQKGTYGNGDGKDASHKGGKIVGFEAESKNRGRAEKSRLKKESVNEIFPKGAGRKISKAMQKGYTLYTTDKRGKKVKKIKTYDSRQSAAVAMGKLMKNLDTDYFPKNVDGLMYIQESVNEGKFNPNKIKIHTNKAIGYLKQAQKFTKEGQKGAVWQRIGDAKDELKIADKFLESVNEDGHTDVASAKRKAMLMVEYSNKLLNKLNEMNKEDSLPSWLSDKITLASDYLHKATHYLLNPVESVNEGVGKRITVKEVKKWMKTLEEFRYKKISPVDARRVASFINNKLKEVELPQSLQKKWSEAKYSREKYLAARYLKSNKNTVKESKDCCGNCEDGKTCCSVSEEIQPQGNIKKVLDVAKNKQAKKIGGTLVDLTTASMMTQVWDKVNDSSKEKMNKMNTKQLTNLILKFWKAVGTPRI